MEPSQKIATGFQKMPVFFETLSFGLQGPSRLSVVGCLRRFFAAEETNFLLTDLYEFFGLKFDSSSDASQL